MRVVLGLSLLVLAVAALAWVASRESPPPAAGPSVPSPEPRVRPRRARAVPPPVAAAPGALAGRVRGAGTGQGAWVAVTGAGSERRAVLPPDGAFEFPALPAGVPLDLWLGPDDAGARLVRLEGGIALAPGERRWAEYDAPAGPALSLLVTDAEGVPVAGARVAVLDPDEDWREAVPVAAETDAGGRCFVGFGKQAPRQALRLVVDAVRAGLVLEERVIEPDPDGAVVETTVVLEQGLRIGGRVAGPDGQPVPGAEVHIVEDYRGDRMVRRPAEGRVRTDAAGAFLDDAYRPGVYRVTADGHCKSRRIAAVKTGVVAGDLDVTLSCRGFGRVFLEFADEVTNEFVKLEEGSLQFVYGNDGEEEDYADWVDLSGRTGVACENLPEGHYRVVAWHPAHEELFSDLLLIEAGSDIGLLRFALRPR